MKKAHQLLLSEKQKEMLEELKEDTGITTISGIFFLALTKLHRSYHPLLEITEEKKENEN
jgi:preprotein translocase subunit YajC